LELSSVHYSGFDIAPLPSGNPVCDRLSRYVGSQSKTQAVIFQTVPQPYPGVYWPTDAIAGYGVGFSTQSIAFAREIFSIPMNIGKIILFHLAKLIKRG
jgi:hypothetical protein